MKSEHIGSYTIEGIRHGHGPAAIRLGQRRRSSTSMLVIGVGASATTAHLLTAHVGSTYTVSMNAPMLKPFFRVESDLCNFQTCTLSPASYHSSVIAPFKSGPCTPMPPFSSPVVPYSQPPAFLLNDFILVCLFCSLYGTSASACTMIPLTSPFRQAPPWTLQWLRPRRNATLKSAKFFPVQSMPFRHWTR
jgi:hypothetical protein